MSSLAAVLLLGASLLASWLVPWFNLTGAFTPDLVLIAVMVTATRRPRVESVMLAAAAGLLCDVVSSAPFASHALVLVVLAYATGRITSTVLVPSFPVRLTLLAVAPLAMSGVWTVLAHVLSRAAAPASGTELAARSLATTLAGIVLWRTSEHQVERRSEASAW
jgi:rod shape-determining protein MreD